MAGDDVSGRPRGTRSRGRTVRLGVLLGFALAAGTALAGPPQAPATPKQPPKQAQPLPEDLLPDSAIEVDDPIGVDPDSRSLDSVGDDSRAARAKTAPPPAEQARFGPEPAPPAARAGEVLTAAPGTRETAHRVQVELAPGFARVRVELEFEGRVERPSELRYRLAVPAGGRLTALEVCTDAGCRPGAVADGASAARAYLAALLARPTARGRSLPIAQAEDVRDARGEAIAVRAAPLLKGAPLRLRLTYLAPVALQGGVLRLTLPARGMDPQVAPAELRLAAKGMIDPRIAGSPAGAPAVSVDPWAEAELQARAASAGTPAASAFELACGTGQRCGLAQVSAGPRPSAPVDLVIALDVSPSTEGAARGRLVPTVAALLATLPEGSRVRALAFAARAQPLVEQPMEPSQVQLAPFAAAVAGAELGSATRFEAVWELAGPWLEGRRGKRGPRPLIAIVGDGGLTVGEARAFERARAAGVEVSAINAADRPATPALRTRVLRSGGLVIDAGAQADAATRGRDPRVLEERLQALYAETLARTVTVVHGATRTELGPLRAGEQLAWRGPLRGGGLRLLFGGRTLVGRAPAERELAAGLGALALAEAGQAAGKALAALDPRDLAQPGQGWPEQPAKGACDRRGPARRFGGLSTDALPVALAQEIACRPAAAPPAASSGAQAGRGMPADPLLSMLRQRILPVARGCFRRDRAGRAEYQKRAVFAFTLAEREIVDARVEGPIPAALQQCLLGAVDGLEVPRFTGTVHVTYPLVTESVPLPEQIQLETRTAGTIDQLFGEGTK